MKDPSHFFDFAAEVGLTKHNRIRTFVKEIKQGGIVPKNLEDYFGYGIFVGRKPA